MKPKPAAQEPGMPEVPFEAHGRDCLNCGQKVHLPYCGHCGQRHATHRLSVKHFLLHDVVHGIWHVDRGILYTLKEVVVRPGYAARSYIAGRRTGRFPILTMLLLLLAALLWVRGLNHAGKSLEEFQAGTRSGKLGQEMSEFVIHNIKWLLLGILPFSALGCKWAYRRAGYNYAEHLVINAYVFGGSLVLLLLMNLAYLPLRHKFELFSGVSGYLTNAFYLLGYWQAYRHSYTVGGFVWRTLAAAFLSFVLLAALILVLAIIGGVYLALHPALLPK